MSVNTAAGGNLSNFFELHKSMILIPPIQRDYAQGRVDIEGEGVKYKRIRKGLLRSLYDALYNNSDNSITLDYIYGAKDKDSDAFIPVDGQQRLTTLFLLHWYIAVKEDRHADAIDVLKAFSYEIRDAAKEFCRALAENDIVETNQKDYANKKAEYLSEKEISKTIKERPWYHEVYDDDPTVCAMLVMLDDIHDQFRNAPEEKKVFDDLYNVSPKDSKIAFWYLSLDEFRLTDDLYIKINARGKELTPFENFKANLEDKLKNKKYKHAFDKWCIEIDNKWLESFWKHSKRSRIKNVEKVEEQMFRVILFYLDCKMCEIGTDGYSMQDINKTDVFDYEQHIKLCETNEAVFVNMVSLLDNINFLMDNAQATLDEFLYNASSITLKGRAKLYAIMEYVIVLGPDAKKYSEFERVCFNLITGQRREYFRRMTYESSLENNTFSGFLSGINSLINEYKTSPDMLSALSNMNEASFAYMKQEKQILALTQVNDVTELEKKELLNGLIHNFIDSDNNKLLLTASEFDELSAVDPKLLLMAILSFCKDDDNIQYHKYGANKNQNYIYFNNKDVSGNKFTEPYFTHRYGFHDNVEFGDYIWTSDKDNDYSAPVKLFISEYAKKKTGNAVDRVKNIISNRLPHCDGDIKIWLENEDIFFDSVTKEHPYVFIYWKGTKKGFGFRICYNEKDWDISHYDPYECVSKCKDIDSLKKTGRNLY